MGRPEPVQSPGSLPGHVNNYASTSATRSKPLALPKSSGRVAYWSPLPPARSGIADYSAELLKQLGKRYDVALFSGDSFDLASDVAQGYGDNSFHVNVY